MVDDAGKLDRVLFELGRGSGSLDRPPEWGEGYRAAIDGVRRALGALGQDWLAARPFRVEGRGYAPFLVLAPSARAVAEALAAFAKAARVNTGDAPVFLVLDPLEAERRISLAGAAERGEEDGASDARRAYPVGGDLPPAKATQRPEGCAPHIRLVDLARTEAPARLDN